MRKKLVCLLRWYGRRRIAWCLYVHDVQEKRFDDEPLAPDAERKARAWF